LSGEKNRLIEENSGLKEYIKSLEENLSREREEKSTLNSR